MSCLIWFQDFCRFFFLWTFSQLLSVLQIVSCLKVRSTGLRFFSLSLVVVVVLLYLTVRAALGKRKSVETSWAAIIEFCAAANWRWRAYYFFVSDRQRGTEMMETDCALSREILSTFSYFLILPFFVFLFILSSVTICLYRDFSRSCLHSNF
jgi:glucan phosphoethanolaminetransferase (alkaline phosphatase superfamily)